MKWAWRPIAKGETYWEPCQGGVVQREAECDGVLIEGVGVIPANELRAALLELAGGGNGHSEPEARPLLSNLCCGWSFTHAPECKGVP